MNYNFLNIFLDKKDLLNQDSKEAINEYLLQNNASQIENFYNFYSGKTNIACVTGFLGTGKKQITDYSLSFLAPEAVVFKYNCFQSTVLDDILLSFYVNFKKLFSQKAVEEPKFRSENFAQKINTYFLKIEKPFVIVLNSFNELSKENKQEIFDFIVHLSTFEKVKIIIISKAFPSDMFTGKDLNYERIALKALDTGLFEKYLKSKKIHFNTSLSEKLYSSTRGYFLYTTLVIKYLQYNNETLEVFFDKLSKSFMSFDDFIGKKILDIVPATSRNLFWFISMIRHSASFNLLNKMNLYDKEVINLLIENGIFVRDDDDIYVREYFKDKLDVSVAVNISQKIHQYIINLYDNELPLKPLERDLILSRQTMRKEIEYHRLFLPKRPVFAEGTDFDANYVSYSKGLEFDLTRLSKEVKEPPKLDKRFLEKKKQKENETLQVKQIKNPKLNLSNLSIQTGTINTGDIEKPQEFDFEPKQAEKSVQKPELSFKELMVRASMAENDYKYSRALDLYQKALAQGKNKVENKIIADIYIKVAHCYQNLSNNDEALKNYYLAQDLFTDEKNYIQANYIKLSISKLLYESYKFELAREYALNIIKYEQNPPILKVKAYIQLSYIEEGFSNQQKAYEYIEQAVKNATDAMDSETLAELFFKYALSQDDKGNYDVAVEYYEKCIQMSPNFAENKFLSSAYSNIAALYAEKGNSDKAIENYKKSYNIDNENNNFEGIYYSASKLGNLLRRKDASEALNYYNASLSASKNLNDVFYIASAYLALGDFYYNTKANEQALAQYFWAQKIAMEHFSEENKARIDMRINDLKVKMGIEHFNETVKKLREEQT